MNLAAKKSILFRSSNKYSCLARTSGGTYGDCEAVVGDTKQVFSYEGDETYYSLGPNFSSTQNRQGAWPLM